MFFQKKSEKNHNLPTDYVLFSLNDLKMSIADEVKKNVDKMVSREFIRAEQVRRLRIHLKQKIHKKEKDLHTEKKPYLWPFVPICLDLRAYSRMYSSTEDAFELIRSSGNISTINVPLLKNCFEKFFSRVQNLPCRNLRDGHIFSHSIELIAEMILIAKKKTYLYCDYNTQSVSFVLLLIGFSHDIREVFSHKILGAIDHEEFNPYTTTLYDFCLRQMNGSLYELNEQYPQLTFEQSLTLSHLYLKEVWDEILLLLTHNKDEILLKEILNLSRDSLLYKVYTSAHNNILNERSVEEGDDFLETVRPIISGRAMTSKNWYEDPQLRKNVTGYSENVLKKPLTTINNNYSCKIEDKATDPDIKERTSEGTPVQNQSPPPLVNAQKDQKSCTPPDIPLVFGDKKDFTKDKETNFSSNADQNKLDPMSTEAINHRYVYKHNLKSIMDIDGDEKFLSNFKQLMGLALKKENKDPEIKALLSKRCKKYHQFLEVEESFIKDKVTIVDYDLKHALVHAETFKDYLNTVLCLEHALREQRTDNRIGLNYIHRFLKNELSFFKKLFLI